MGYRIGLDVGTNSLGWSVLELDETGKVPIGIINSGVRIFQDGRQVKSKSTLKSVRTLARSSRRRLDRYKQRRKYLLTELVKYGLFPGSEPDRRALQDIEPLMLRARGLDDKLSLYKFGRALFHLNQRRGFKSNRKDAESREGIVRESINDMVRRLTESGSRTMGEFLWNRREQGWETRVRRLGAKTSDLYQLYPSRELLEDEFHKLWDSQAQHYPDKLTAELKQHFFDIIYFQRPLKPQAKGFCSYITSEPRCYRALPSFQRYRVLQEVNNLEWTTTKGTFRLIEIPQARDLVLEQMLRPTTKKGNVVFSKIAAIVKELELAEGNFKFNLQSDIRKHLDGDLTAALLSQDSYIGKEWYAWETIKQDELVSLLLDPEIGDEDVINRLVNQFELSEERAKRVLNAPLSDGTSNVSLKAVHMLAELMFEEYLIQPDAVQKLANTQAEFRNPYQLSSENQLLDALPYYGEYVRGHIIPGQGNEKDYQSKVGMVTNPTVHIALNQLRQVVNELIKRYGKPVSIAIELGRDLPASEMQRKKHERELKANQDRNSALRDKLIELGRSVTHDNLTRLKLWEELGENPTDRRCVFTGDIIGIGDLFNGNCEIEHLIPFSRSLDDSLANKTICFRRANRDKGDRTPYDAFGHSPGEYNWAKIFERAQLLSESKQWRFKEDALAKWLNDEGDFLARHLNDTRYIGRLAREYLTAICPPQNIHVLTGRMTSLLRHHWGLNTVLNLSDDAKNRDDHRHHAVDAIVVGMTTRSSLQRLHRAARRSEKMDLDRIIESGEEIEPWPGFRDHVEKVIQEIVVSHKPTRNREGKMHNDTAMGVLSGPDSKKRYQVVIRKRVDAFKTIKSLETVKDARLRDRLLELAEDVGIEEAFRSLGVKSVRTVESMKVIPIRDQYGNVYKAYKGDSNWGMEIYQTPDSDKWEEVMVTRFKANQTDNQCANLRKPHPAARLVMRLHRNDYLLLKIDGEERLLRVQKLSSGKVAMAAPHEANSDARDRESSNAFSFIIKSVSALQKLGAVKVDVSPSGMVSQRG